MALALVPLLAMVGVASEGSSWLLTQRSMQNAADAAVLAAATSGATNGNAVDTGTPPMAAYAREAAGVAAQYGFTNGAANTSVSTVNSVTCPDGTAGCYQVTISRKLALAFVQLAGFSGDTTIGSRKALNIVASAVAEPVASPAPLCILGLDSTAGDDGIRSDGGSKVDLAGCSIFSNSNAVCNGHNLGATIGGAVGTNPDCGITPLQGLPTVTDPYASLAANIAPNTCTPTSSASAYPQESKKTPAATQLSGSYTAAQLTQVYCGDVALSGDVTVTSGNAVITIENGQLDLGNYTLLTNSGVGLTVVFTGPPVSGLSPSSYITGGGTLNAAAPTSGPWSGVSIYQDPSLPSSQTSFAYTGNSPTWDITGLAYFPTADVALKGAVGKASNGYNCFAFVANQLLIDGTGSVFSNPTSQCAQAGLVTPNAYVGQRPKLVQ
jgi:hypothetical protein